MTTLHLFSYIYGMFKIALTSLAITLASLPALATDSLHCRFNNSYQVSFFKDYKKGVYYVDSGDVRTDWVTRETTSQVQLYSHSFEGSSNIGTLYQINKFTGEAKLIGTALGEDDTYVQKGMCVVLN